MWINLLGITFFFELVLLYYFIFLVYLFYLSYNKQLNNGDWGLGIGDWGLGIGPNPQYIKLNNLNIMSNIKIKIKLIKIIQINYILLKTICFFKIIT